MAATLIPALLVAVTALYGFNDRQLIGVPVSWMASLVAIGIVVSQQKNAIRFGVSVAAIAVAGAWFDGRSENVLYTGRSFFGTYRVERSGNGANTLLHGTTIHGAQFLVADRKREPLTYYHTRGPVGQMFAALDSQLTNGRVAAVGLGAGSLLCYGKAGQEWTFFEIDPLVESIARTPQYFTFLTDCPVATRVVIGDARITLAREQDASYSLLVLDAFTSDAIPVHLLTREAFGLYTRLLDAQGVLLIHVSNRHLRLESVVTELAAASGLTGLYADHSATSDHEELDLEYSCDWILLARDTAHLGALAADGRWRALVPSAGRRVWSDDYSNVFSVLRW
jgi:spermidine synthase